MHRQSLTLPSFWCRLLIMLSALWVFVVGLIYEPWRSSRDIQEFLAIGVLPLLLLWGGLWVFDGFYKERHKNTSNNPSNRTESASGTDSKDSIYRNFLIKLSVISLLGAFMLGHLKFGANGWSETEIMMALGMAFGLLFYSSIGGLICFYVFLYWKYKKFKQAPYVKLTIAIWLLFFASNFILPFIR